MQTHSLLTAEEEIALARRARAGDTTARNTLIEHNLRFAASVARQYAIDDPATDRDDLFQEAVLALFTAVERFDPERGIRFTTYAYHWLRQRVQRKAHTAGAIRRSAHPDRPPTRRQSSIRAHEIRQAKVLSLNTSVSLDDGEGDEYIDRFASDDDTEAEAFNRLLVSKYLKLLDSPRQLGVVQDWMVGYSSAEAGERHGVSRSVVRLAIKNIRKKARDW